MSWHLSGQTRSAFWLLGRHRVHSKRISPSFPSPQNTQTSPHKGRKHHPSPLHHHILLQHQTLHSPLQSNPSTHLSPPPSFYSHYSTSNPYQLPTVAPDSLSSRTASIQLFAFIVRFSLSSPHHLNLTPASQIQRILLTSTRYLHIDSSRTPTPDIAVCPSSPPSFLSAITNDGHRSWHRACQWHVPWPECVRQC